MQKTFAPNSKKISKDWHFIDADNKVLGRLAAEIVVLLMGKNKAVYAPNAEVGDKVVVTNAAKIAVTGRKLENKVYHHYTGFPGGLRTETLGKLLDRKPTEVLRKAVMGMLPKNRLGAQLLSNLHVYTGNEHPHAAQQPKEVKLNSIK